MTITPNNVLGPTRAGVFGSAIADHVHWSRAAQLGRSLSFLL